MILKNKTIIPVACTRVGLGPIVSSLNKSTKFIPKGFNFSSLYQNANLSTTSLGAKAISNKAITSNASNSLILKKETTVASVAIATASARVLQSQTLGPINNTKLLNYNFLANTKIATQPQAIDSNNKVRVAPRSTVYSEDIIKLISAFFKSIYCLISRPKFINTPDKIIIEILYYITIPDHNIFKWYNFIYNTAYTKATTAKFTQENKLPKASNIHVPLAYAKRERNIVQIKKKPTIKTILLKNFLIKKTLFKLNNTNIVNLYINKFAILFKLLQLRKQQFMQTAIINKPIEFNLIRIHKSDYDSNILAQLFILILKKKNIRIAINKLYTKNNIGTATLATQVLRDNQKKEYNFIPAYISGLYIKIGGRLMREPIIPRITTKKFEIGAIATGKVNFVDSARITKKNKKGAYTIKITYAQNFVF